MIALMLGIVVLVAIVLYLFVRMKEVQNKILLIILLLFLLTFYLSFSNIVSKNEINLLSADGLTTAGKLYFAWLGTTFSNFKTIIGNALNLDWKINSTIIDDEK